MIWDAEAEHWTIQPAHGFIVTTHVCGLPPGHVNSIVEGTRRHLCRKVECSFWWIELDHNPFAGADDVEG